MLQLEKRRFKEINNSNLILQNEITKNESLIDQINTIIEINKNNSTNKIINSGFKNIFNNNYTQSQKNIASNRNKYLHSEKEIIRKNSKNNFKKIKLKKKPQIIKEIISVN